MAEHQRASRRAVICHYSVPITRVIVLDTPKLPRMNVVPLLNTDQNGAHAEALDLGV